MTIETTSTKMMVNEKKLDTAIEIAEAIKHCNQKYFSLSEYEQTPSLVEPLKPLINYAGICTILDTILNGKYTNEVVDAVMINFLSKDLQVMFHNFIRVG